MRPLVFLVALMSALLCVLAPVAQGGSGQPCGGPRGGWLAVDLPLRWWRDGGAVEFSREWAHWGVGRPCVVELAGAKARASGQDSLAVSDRELARAAAPLWESGFREDFFSVSPDRLHVLLQNTGLGAGTQFPGSPLLVAVDAVAGAPTTPPATSGPWRPDGGEFVYVTSAKSLVARDLAGNERPIAPLAASPSYSPTGTSIAYLENDALHVVSTDGSGDTTVTQADSYAWLSDGTGFVIAAPSRQAPWDRGRGIWANARAGPLQVISLDGTVQRTLADEGRNPVLSPDGTMVAITGWQGCREGIFVVPVAGGAPRRLTQPCLRRGTPGDDHLHGSWQPDKLAGLAGDDHIIAGSYHDRDDTIDAGPGNDHVEAGGGGDVIYGRSGDDLLEGQRGSDYLVGGRGRDTLRAGPGSDTIDARDGEPDLISCGTGPDPQSSRDVVLADDEDTILPDCAHDQKVITLT